MKALVLKKNGAPESAFEIRDVADPVAGPGQVLVDVEFSGLNYADVAARLGTYPDAPPLPSVLGYDVVGRVKALGSGVKDLEIGTRVVAFTRFGGYAKLAVAPRVGVSPIADGWDGAAATALATQGCTAWYAAEEMVRIHSGDHVLIHAAAGGVGQILVQLARRRGAVIYGTTGSPAKLAKLKQLGVDYPICAAETDFETVVQKHAGERGLDVIFDSVGGSVSRKGLKRLAAGGRIVLYGAASMGGEKKSFVKAARMAAGFGLIHPISLLMSSRSVLGVNMLRIADSSPAILGRCLSAIVGAVHEGALQLAPATVYPVADFAKAHHALGGRQSSGKVALGW